MLERFFLYSQRQQLAASQIIQDARIEIRPNADFYMRAMAFQNASGAIAGRFRRADASWFTGNQFAHLGGFFVTGGFARWMPIHPQIRYPASGAFVYDLQDLGGAGDINVYPMLIGVERYEDGALPGPALPPRYMEFKHDISITQTISGAGTQLLDIPIRCQTGDAFAIRTLSWRFLESASEPSTLAVRIRDEYGRSYMNDWVPLRMLFGGPTEADSPTLPTPYPQLVIPANGAYSIDFWNRADGVGPFTVELVFGGVRCVAVNE